jgi:hypothetical protein
MPIAIIWRITYFLGWVLDDRSRFRLQPTHQKEIRLSGGHNSTTFRSNDSLKTKALKNQCTSDPTKTPPKAPGFFTYLRALTTIHNPLILKTKNEKKRPLSTSHRFTLLILSEFFTIMTHSHGSHPANPLIYRNSQFWHDNCITLFTSATTNFVRRI